MKIWAISDLHTKYRLLTIPDDIDMVICAGDASTTREWSFNEVEYRSFLDWYSNLPITHKVLIAGNHDTAVYNGLIKPKYIKSLGITYLNDETVIIDGIKIFGSPWTPTFGYGWGFNCDRSKLYKHWELIEEDTDIVITHGPGYGILDNNEEGKYCGDKSLTSALMKIQPKYNIFGHIHEQGGRQLKISDCKTTFINASVVGLRHGIINNGHIIEI
jgi:Icc-related predicted phosphoesterase